LGSVGCAYVCYKYKKPSCRYGRPTVFAYFNIKIATAVTTSGSTEYVTVFATMWPMRAVKFVASCGQTAADSYMVKIVCFFGQLFTIKNHIATILPLHTDNRQNCVAKARLLARWAKNNTRVHNVVALYLGLQSTLCLKKHPRHFRLQLVNRLADFDNFW